MSTRHVLIGERVNNPSGQQIRKALKLSRTIEGFKVKPGYLYTVVRAISARVNQNYDGWPSDELKKSYHTFIGKPCFVNHENYDPTKARGVVVAARYRENGNDKFIEVIQEIDAKRFPKLAHEIRTGGLDSVSMGAEAGFTICSYCGNRATDVPDMCEHVLYHKGEKLARFNRRTGKREQVLVYESCHKLSFFELSYVFDPADETAVASKVLVANNHGHKHAGECLPGQNCSANIPDKYKAPALKDPQFGVVDSAGNMINHAVPYGPGETPGLNQPADTAPGTAPANPAAATTPATTPAPTTPATAAPAAVTPPAPQKAGGKHTADKCHYCAGDAEEGFSSCSGHRKMEENKFKAKVLAAAGFRQANHPGAGQGWSYDADSDTYDHPSGHVLRPSDEKPGSHQLWAPTVVMNGPHGLAKDRQPHSDLQKHFDWVERTGASARPFHDPDGRYTGPMKTKTSWPPSPYNENSDFCPECGQHFAQGHTPGCSLASKWGNKRAATDEDWERWNEHALSGDTSADDEWSAKKKKAIRKGAPFADYSDFDDCTSKNQDKGDADAYCGEIKHRTEDKESSHRVSKGDHRGRPAADHEAQVSASMAVRVLQAWGETEAPAAVDTLREEGSAPEDDNNDFYHYVEPPKELQTPDLSEAAQIDRDQEQEGQGAADGMPGPASPDAGAPGQPQQQFMELKIPIPQPGQAGAPGAPQIPMQAYGNRVTAATLDYFDRYFGHRVADWRDAIEAGRALTAEEGADYSRQAMKLSTLENSREVSTTNRNPVKGTANMARSTLANRSKVVTAGRRQHFADGPLVDSGDQSRNDQGEQEEVFITQTPPAEQVDMPADDEQNISNTENNLVARVQRGRAQLLADAQKLAALRARQATRRRTAGDQDEAGGPVATEVDPQVNTGPAGEELTGDDFESADPNAGVVETQPKDASLHAFRAFDKWLASSTGKPSRLHTSATIRRAADDFSRRAGISVQAMFPALGIVLREARKNEKAANAKGAKMRKRADEKLEVAAPDGRVDVETPVEGTTDADAQASQFDINDFGNNAGDNIADPDLSTDQNWAPGEANKTSRRTKTAGGLLAFRCAEAMIAAGLEPNDAERKYALAAQFEHMNRGLVQDRVALCERFAAVLHNERRKVASGSTRGAALQPPVPPGLTQGASPRTASQIRVAANDPRNDSSLFV